MRRVYLGQPPICHNVVVNNVEHNELVDTIRDWAAGVGFSGCWVHRASSSMNTRPIFKNGWMRAITAPWTGWTAMAPNGVVPLSSFQAPAPLSRVRMDYQPEARRCLAGLEIPRTKAFVSRYAVGRDYHKIIRSRLAKLADRIRSRVGFGGLQSLRRQRPRSRARHCRTIRARLDSKKHHAD